MPVILALKMLCQEDHELGVSLDYIARACLKSNQINKQASKWAHNPRNVSSLHLGACACINKVMENFFLPRPLSPWLVDSQVPESSFSVSVRTFQYPYLFLKECWGKWWPMLAIWGCRNTGRIVSSGQLVLHTKTLVQTLILTWRHIRLETILMSEYSGDWELELQPKSHPQGSNSP